MTLKRSILFVLTIGIGLFATVQIGQTEHLNTDSSIYIPILFRQAREPDHVVGNGTPASCTESVLATALSAGGYIVFDCGDNDEPHKIAITGALVLDRHIELDGNDAVVLDGDGRSHLLTIAEGRTVTIRNMAIQNSASSQSAVTVGANSTVQFEAVDFANNRTVTGRASCSGGGAIAIEADSQVTIVNSVFRNNQAVNGGAIHNQNGDLTIRSSYFVGNQAIQATRSQQTLDEQYLARRRVPLGVCAGGGAIYTDGVGGRLTIIDTIFENNVTNQHGGAMFLALRNRDRVTIKDSAFEGNVARVSSEWSGTGGALWIGEAQLGQEGMAVTIGESSFVNNSAEFQGGAIYNRIPMRLENSTLTENVARNPAISDLNAWQRGSGGALRIDQTAQTILDNVTLARNTAGYQGGGISGSGAAARNTLIVDNRAEWAHNLYHNCKDEVANWGHNIQFLSTFADRDHLVESSCGSHWQRNPRLGALGMHSGNTKSIALLAGSAAIDAGNPTTCKTYDQRYVQRTFGSICDIGAFEATDSIAPTTPATGTPSIVQTPTAIPTTGNTLTPTPIATNTPTATNTPAATPTATATPDAGGDHIVGNGSPASCTEAEFARVLALGGSIRFNCGAGNVTIPLTQRHMMLLDTTIDGGGRITLDGQYFTALLGSEEHLEISLRNIDLINGNSDEEGAGINVGYWNDFRVENVLFLNNVSHADHKVCDGGGAIFIGGGSVAHIEGSTFKNNAAMNGGGINNLRTKLTVLDSHFEGNTALHTASFNQLGDCGGGGALYLDGTRKPEDGGADELILRNLTFVDNLTNNVGGAVFLGVRTHERIIIEDVLFRGNRAIQGDASFDTAKGGALWIGQGVGGQTGYDIDLNRVTFIDNRSEFQGGALWTRSPVDLTNVTFYGNVALDHRITDADNWRAGIGGAMTAGDQARVTLNHVSVVANTAGFVGGGLNGENIIMMNSLVANNVGQWWRGLQQNCTHAPQNWGGNLQFITGHPDAQHAWNSNCGDTIPVADPMLGPPQIISDLITIVPLQSGSAAIDGGVSSHCATTDQRGIPRPIGGACDIGAYEYAP